MAGNRFQITCAFVVLPILFMSLMTGCKPAQVTQVTVSAVPDLPAISVHFGDVLPALPEQVDVIYSNGKHGRLPVSWEAAAWKKRPVWQGIGLNGTIVDQNERLEITQRISVLPPESLAADTPALPRDSMAGLEYMEVEWSGREIGQELRDELNALLFRARLITGGFFYGSFLMVNMEDSITINGKGYYLADDRRLPTFADFMAFIECTYTGELLSELMNDNSYIVMNGKFYWEVDGSSSVCVTVSPFRMKVLEVSNQKIQVELSVTKRCADGPTYDDVSLLEFLSVGGKWLVVSQGFEV